MNTKIMRIYYWIRIIHTNYNSISNPQWVNCMHNFSRMEHANGSIVGFH